MPIVSAVISPDTGRGHAFKNTLWVTAVSQAPRSWAEQGGSVWRKPNKVIVYLMIRVVLASVSWGYGRCTECFLGNGKSLPSPEECRGVRQVKGTCREVSWPGGGCGGVCRELTQPPLLPPQGWWWSENCKCSSGSFLWVESRVQMGLRNLALAREHAGLSFSLLLPLANP